MWDLFVMSSNNDLTNPVHWIDKPVKEMEVAEKLCMLWFY